MRIDRSSATDEDRLNDFWDGLVDGKAPANDSGHRLTAPEQQLETLVLYLESLKPRVSPSNLGALDLRVSRHFAEDLPMNVATPCDRSRSTTAVPPGTKSSRSRIGFVVRAFDGLAATLLILVVVSGLVLVGPARNLLDSEVPGRFASILGVDEDDSTEQGIGSHSMTSVEVRPGEYEGGRVEVGLWEVTLPPGSAMSGAPTGDEPPVTFGFAVSNGAVVFFSNGEEQPAGPDVSVGGHPELEYVRNASADPATLLVLAPTPATITFPLTIGPWVVAGSPAASPAINPQSMDTEPVLISSVDLTGQKAFQYRVLVTETVLAPGMDLGDVRLFGPPTSRLRAVVVREGRLAIVPDGPLATPAMAEELVPGDTVQLEADGFWSSDLRVTGSENATVLGLLTMPAADNHTLNQSIESVAPFWGEWTIPESGQVDLAIRRLTLAPEAAYSLPTDAGVLYHVASGTILASNSDTEIGGLVRAGGTVAQNSGVTLALYNPESEPAELVQVVVSATSNESLYARESLDRVTVEWLVRETETLTPGPASLMLQVHQYNGQNDGASSGQGPSLVLITPADGDISVRRDGGNAELVSEVGEDPVTPALGEGNRIGHGGYLLARPGAGWHVTGASGAPSNSIVFSVSPDPGPGATPVPIPTTAPGTIGTVTLVGDSSSCDIARLTSDDVANALATPVAADSPLDRSMRDVDGDPADRLTFDAIVYRLQEYADCVATGDYARIYAFYSDEAIRESDVIQDLVRSGHDVGRGPSAQVSFEDLRIFSDGRAGARAVIDGEAAYLTFVYEDGAWKIDVWDDSDSHRPTDATPTP